MSQRSRTATPGYRSSTAANRARERDRVATPGIGVRQSVAHPLLPQRLYTPDGVAQNELVGKLNKRGDTPAQTRKARAYSTAPWIEALKTISPLTNSAKTKQHFPDSTCRFASDEWRNRTKRRTSSIPLQSHDRSLISDSHLLRSHKDHFDEPDQEAPITEKQRREGRNKRGKHWGLVPAACPNVAWSDSNLTRKMADFHVRKEHKDKHGGNVFGRAKSLIVGRNAFVADFFTESAQPQDMQQLMKDGATTAQLGMAQSGGGPNARTSNMPRSESTDKPRDLWSRAGSEVSIRTQPGMPAKSQLRPQDAVFAGRAALGREGTEQHKERFRSPFATHVAPANDFQETTEWNRTH